MTEFSVNTRNRFALGLDDEEETDLHELLEKELEEKQRKAKEAEEAKRKATEKSKKDNKRNSSAKTNTKRLPNKSTDNSTNISNQTSQSSYHRDNATTAKSSNYSRNDENRPPRLRNVNQNRSPTTNENMNFEKPPQDFNRERRDGGNFRGRGRGMRGGFGGNRPRREYERHSGSDKTGIKAVEKRDGFGAHNWGDEISSQLEQPSAEEQGNELAGEQTRNGELVEGEVPAEGETPAEGEAKTGEKKEEVKEEMTYEEYLAQNTRTKTVFENTRKANEGVDTKQWKKAVPLQRKKKGDHSDEEYEEVTDDEEEAVNATKSTLEKLNIQITFGDRRGRGGRGRGFSGPRGGRGGYDSRAEGGFNSRGGSDKRGGRGKQDALQIDNVNFPTLGGK